MLSETASKISDELIDFSEWVAGWGSRELDYAGLCLAKETLKLLVDIRKPREDNQIRRMI